MNAPAIQARFDIRQDDFMLQANLDLPGRGVTALFGPSGAGKTTLLRAIAGLDRHAGAYVRINDELWQDDETGVFVPVHRRALGYVFQEASLLPHLTVRRNLEFGWKRSGAENRQVDMRQTLALLGIEYLLDRRPAHLSGGERQRVAIARALLASPRLLLMDEPLASLDTARKQEVLPYLERIHDQLAIPAIYVSHSLEEVARLADHVVLLNEGKVAASGPIAEITSRLDLSTAFEDEAGIVVTGTVESCNEAYGLTQLRIAGNLVQVVHHRLSPGASLRLRILAREVGLSLTPHQDSSVLNQLPARVLAVMPGKTAAHVILSLDASGMPLLARITSQSHDRLQIAVGCQVWAHFKAVMVFSAE